MELKLQRKGIDNIASVNKICQVNAEMFYVELNPEEIH